MCKPKSVHQSHYFKNSVDLDPKHPLVIVVALNVFACLLCDLTEGKLWMACVYVWALHTHSCVPKNVWVHTMAQWLFLQVAWHWFDIQGHANIMRPVRAQWADADRWPHPLDLDCYCNSPMVRALHHLEKTAHWLVLHDQHSRWAVWEAAKQWEGSIRQSSWGQCPAVYCSVKTDLLSASSIIMCI